MSYIDDADRSIRRPPRDERFVERCRRWTDRDAVRWGVVVCVAAAIGLGMWWHSPPVVPEDVLPRTSTTEVRGETAGGVSVGGVEDATAPEGAAGPTAIAAGATVHVVGQVRTPGLVELDHGARIADAIERAGGPTDTADLHRLNLATVVADGMRIEVPAVGDPVGAAPLVIPPVGGDGGTGGGPVDVNSATAEQLEELRGIGPALAAAIVEYRDEHGPFASLEQLTEVPGIGPAKLDALRDDAVAGR